MQPTPGPASATFAAVIAVILAAGVFGGFVSVALAAAPAGETPPERRLRIRNAIIAGVGASALVPLFLQTVSSTLLGEVLGGGDASNWFVFGGFCLLAAISARAFIQTLSDRALQAAMDAANDAQRKTEVLAGRTDRLEGGVRAATDALRYGTTPTDQPPGAAAAAAAEAPIAPGTVADDPWKGALGGQARSNGRQLAATLRPVDHPDWQAITLTVTADAGAPPLSGSVQFLLHPSFANDRPVVAVQGGEATLTVMSWGAFTAGAVADGGATKLELDLSQLAGAPEPWRSR